MANGRVSLKRIGVDKTNSRIVGVTAASAFIVIFCIIASISLLGQLMYQNRVISAKRKAAAQLKLNIENTDKLVGSYNSFVGTPQNVLGGNPNGVGAKDGSNAKIVLDALPSTYDFPALASSLEKLMNDQGVQIKSLTGTDDAVAQTSSGTSNQPKPVPVPFEIVIAGNYDQVRNAVNAMERSIRPFQIQKMDISGDQSELSVDITGQTYYQAEKALNITMKVVK